MTTPTPAALRAARILLDDARDLPPLGYLSPERLATDIDEATGLPALLAACKAAEHRYRSMWFDISSTPKPVSNARGEWEMLKAAIAAAEEPTP